MRDRRHLGNVYTETGDLNNALIAYRKAIALSPRHASALQPYQADADKSL